MCGHLPMGFSPQGHGKKTSCLEYLPFGRWLRGRYPRDLNFRERLLAHCVF